MKEMAKSKFMIGFVVFIVGFSYMNSIQMKGMNIEESKTEILLNDAR